MFPNVYDIPYHYRHPVTGLAPGALGRLEDRSMQQHSIAPGEAGGMPESIARQLAGIGAVIDPAATAAIYASLQPTEPYAGVRVVRDQAYGPHERHVLDVFTAAEQPTAAPVVVFVHGGGFARGAKQTPGSPFYDNVMLWAAGEGFVGVNINYRLAPEFMWPAGIEDLSAVAAWIDENIASYGGDPTQVFLWGHSAGAAHVGDFIARRTVTARPVGIAGAILTSGFYNLGNETSIWSTYYGENVATYAEKSSLAGLVASDLPLLINDAELDPPNFGPQSLLLATRRAAAGRPVNYLHLLGHSHISETYAVGTADASLSGPVAAFIRGVAE
jgi:triacylglycerol lipase